MATEADLELSLSQLKTAQENKQIAYILSEMVTTIDKGAKRNNETAVEIARQNAQVKSRNKMNGHDRAWLYGVLGVTFAVLGFFGLIAHNIRQGDAEKMQIILTCENQGGQWRSLGGQDDANKYDEVCVRSGK